MSLKVLLLLSLRASRGQLSTTSLLGGGSQGFNQCTEDLVETRGELEEKQSSAFCPVPHLSLTCPSLPFQVSEPTSEVPDNIRPNHLIKELTKEIRHLEVRREARENERFQEEPVALTTFCSRPQEEPVNGNKPVKSQGSVCAGAPNGFPAPRSPLERLCQARRARRAARRLREQQRHAPKLPSNLDILERHTREVLRRLEVGPLEEVSGGV